MIPAIGFLAYGPPAQDLMPAGRLRALLAEAALQSAQLRFFAATDCDSPGRRINAAIWTAAGFIRATCPVPDVVVVLNRPRRPRDQGIAGWLARHCGIIDDRGPDKLELATLLSAGSLARHVIPFAPLPAADMRATLATWMARREPCVVKPANGQRGNSVFFPQPGSNGEWTLHKDNEALRLPAAVDLIRRRIAGRIARRPFLVQRYVTSRAADGRAADLRAHVQRGANGAWGLTRLYVRLGEAGFLVSNISRGGYQGQAEPFLRQRRVRPAAALLAEAETLALGVAEAIERHQGAPLSELGVDLAIDEADALWLIEANVHPQSSLHEHDRAVRTIAYARHLAATPARPMADTGCPVMAG
ncbi:conserved protein of unknown function [Rhodovastum atsumiense]|uniref:ATP-grasp domain-containing protein n=1 Tax=Rhodovastum atsumiense TaxID=504468 RepID=A0A5M6IRD8_9PROT|nr:YheC/YheD family protein [Rhodovastum atsumiense]KAA5610856.1 hypothetical protein F1189_17425 [Rhodovastum atsumiense]CAH2602089.1 conserved protein of unknown function [Rhodovastum atsumiense]